MRDTLMFLEMIGFVMGYVCSICCLLGFFYWSASPATLTEGLALSASWWIFAETTSKRRKMIEARADQMLEDLLQRDEKNL